MLLNYFFHRLPLSATLKPDRATINRQTKPDRQYNFRQSRLAILRKIKRGVLPTHLPTQNTTFNFAQPHQDIQQVDNFTATLD